MLGPHAFGQGVHAEERIAQDRLGVLKVLRRVRPQRCKPGGDMHRAFRPDDRRELFHGRRRATREELPQGGLLLGARLLGLLLRAHLRILRRELGEVLAHVPDRVAPDGTALGLAVRQRGAASDEQVADVAHLAYPEAL